mmetsp:Transcript_16890/g.43812  ORF Transcript_16890/g.43812 Transcript_16890/m.43812 type:complete len:229 (+) Transcript_16890:2409-3095(+)
MPPRSTASSCTARRVTARATPSCVSCPLARPPRGCSPAAHWATPLESSCSSTTGTRRRAGRRCSTWATKWRSSTRRLPRRPALSWTGRSSPATCWRTPCPAPRSPTTSSSSASASTTSSMRPRRRARAPPCSRRPERRPGPRASHVPTPEPPYVPALPLLLLRVAHCHACTNSHLRQAERRLQQASLARLSRSRQLLRPPVPLLRLLPAVTQFFQCTILSSSHPCLAP